MIMMKKTNDDEIRIDCCHVVVVAVVQYKVRLSLQLSYSVYC